jgi:hypothetical protein
MERYRSDRDDEHRRARYSSQPLGPVEGHRRSQTHEPAPSSSYYYPTSNSAYPSMDDPNYSQHYGPSDYVPNTPTPRLNAAEVEAEYARMIRMGYTPAQAQAYIDNLLYESSVHTEGMRAFPAHLEPEEDSESSQSTDDEYESEEDLRIYDEYEASDEDGRTFASSREATRRVSHLGTTHLQGSSRPATIL